MRKFFLLIVSFLFCGVLNAQTQSTSIQIRETEWQGYQLPSADFVRWTDADKNLVFRVPAGWTQKGDSLVFIGPNNSVLTVYEQKIPDGYFLDEYFAGILRGVKDESGLPDTPVTRKVYLQDLEARELFFEILNAEGEMIRSTSWVVVNGPLALMFNLQVPVAHAVETEPFFKAMVQSVMLVPAEHNEFEKLRDETLKKNAPAPINEVEQIVTSLNEAYTNRESAVERLTAMFVASPDSVVDLLIDRRPLVRTAAVQALAGTKDPSLEPFLWEMIDDADPLVAEAAARNVAHASDVVNKTIERSLHGLNIEVVARVFAFMSKEKRIELLERFFRVTAVPPSKTPPPAKSPTKTDVVVTVSSLTPVKGKTASQKPSFSVSNDPGVQITALTLLENIPAEEFKLPLERLVASKYDPLIAAGLERAYSRGEQLPVASLFKLAASSDERVSKRALLNLGISGDTSDIPRLEALVFKGNENTIESFKLERDVAIKKIRFRGELGKAKTPAEIRHAISQASADRDLVSFAWLYDCEASVAGCAPAGTPATFNRELKVDPFGENVLPARVRHYTAIHNPAEAVQNFYQALRGLQMNSPRTQANVAIMLSNIRQKLGEQLSAPFEAPLIDYTGIDPASPVAFTSWTADHASDATGIAQRKAIVMRVKDRARFEHTVERLQREIGSFTNLTNYVAVGTRAIAALPAIFPLSAQLALEQDPAKTKKGPLRKFSFVAEKEWNGLRIKTIEHRWFSSESEFESAVSYITYLGDTAIVTPDLATIRDLLTRIDGAERQVLADNPEFRKAIDRGGDIVYFSDLNAIMAEVTEKATGEVPKIKESGALTIGSASWENVHHLDFAESDWSKPLLPFAPKEMTAARDLLPGSTLAYLLMNVDLVQAWSNELGQYIQPDLQKQTIWALDLKQEVLPELGSECGAAILDLTFEVNIETVTWAAFCKLKSNKLVDALNAGRLFRDVGPAKDFASVKGDAGTLFVAARNNFLVVSNKKEGLMALDDNRRLASTRDYSKALEKLPGSVVAFGGYNLEAAVATASKKPSEGLKGQIAQALFSLAGAFHSQHFYAITAPGSVAARSSVSMDREGRFSVADLPTQSITFATLAPTGIPISDQNRLSTLKLRLRSKASGPIDNIKDDVKSPHQNVEEKSDHELILTVAARPAGDEKAVALPIKDPQFAADLKATAEFPADNPQVKEQAAKIAGNDRDAWSVARKLADWTNQNLEWKFVASANPEQTLATREADCSEFSTLFVAMARSLGLPARIVSGLAYSSNSFGGHAWVEVWAGRWIELDPTWGTHFVDATHIRNSSSALVTSAALNLIEMEVIEARRTVSDFQKSATALAQNLSRAIPEGNTNDISAALDLEVLTEELMGPGSWLKMNDAEKDQMASAYRRAINQVKSYSDYYEMRVVHVDEKGNRAEAICLLDDVLVKLRLVRRDDLWYLAEMEDADDAFLAISETVRPVVEAIESARAGNKARVAVGDYTRVSSLLDLDANKAVLAADNLLKAKPGDPKLRLLKAIASLELEKGEEGERLLRELSAENFAPALHRLAFYLSDAEDEKTNAEVIAFYERYTQLEPYDPRGFSGLATAYYSADEFEKSEAGYRKVIELTPTASDGYLSLIYFLIIQDRVAEVKAVLLAAEQNTDDKDEDIFGAAMGNLVDIEDSSYGSKLAASEPERMKTSALANYWLAKMYIGDKLYPKALKHAETAIKLDPEDDESYILVAHVHRKESRWSQALKAADKAIELDDEDGEALYERACALARLRRPKEAMAALEKAIELFPRQTEWMANEEDLESLKQLPAFKKLLLKKE